MRRRSAPSFRATGVPSTRFNVTRTSPRTSSPSATGPCASGPKNCATIASCGPSNLHATHKHVQREIALRSSRPSMHALTDAQWSPVRSSIFYTTKMDGRTRCGFSRKGQRPSGARLQAPWTSGTSSSSRTNQHCRFKSSTSHCIACVSRNRTDVSSPAGRRTVPSRSSKCRTTCARKARAKRLSFLE